MELSFSLVPNFPQQSNQTTEVEREQRAEKDYLIPRNLSEAGSVFVLNKSEIIFSARGRVG